MFGISLNSVYTPHLGQGSGRGLSPRLWSRVDGQALAPDGGAIGYFAGDDFTGFGKAAANVYVGEGGVYLSYEDSGSVIIGTTGAGGVVSMTADTTDNDEISIQAGNGTTLPFTISDTAGSDKLLIFETRFRITTPTTLADTTLNFFTGLGGASTACTDFIADTAGVIKDASFLGFQIIESNGDRVRFVASKLSDATTLQIPIADVAGEIVAATWYKAGFVYDPSAIASERIKVYWDNVEHATKVTSTNIATATFPDGSAMNFLAAMQSASGAASGKQVDIDWWACYQAG